MMEVTDSVVINRPIHEVFAYAGDPSNDSSWATVMVESRMTSDGPLQKGSTLVEVLRFLGKRVETRCEVTEYEPDSRIAFTMEAVANKGRHERTFETAGDGTRVTLRSSGDSTGLFKLADPVLKRMGTRQMAADLGILKELLESQAVA
jgi:uncharacterized protein YndB with AHSA1/START domain